MASFFKTVENKVIFSGDGELIYYVPEKYFEIKAAEIVGERTNVIGMFTYAVFDKSGKRLIIKPFNCPTMIECIPNNISKESNYLLEGTKEPKSYRLLHFKNGDELICSTKVPVDFAVLEKFVDIFKGGNLPENIDKYINNLMLGCRLPKKITLEEIKKKSTQQNDKSEDTVQAQHGKPQNINKLLDKINNNKLIFFYLLKVKLM